MNRWPVDSKTCENCGGIGGHGPDCNDLTSLWTDDPSAQRLEALAQRLAAKGSGHTLNRLDYLTEIIQSAEVLRAEAVDQARNEGEPWSAISAQIGISKQAAQQRYGR